MHAPIKPDDTLSLQNQMLFINISGNKKNRGNEFPLSIQLQVDLIREVAVDNAIGRTGEGRCSDAHSCGHGDIFQ